jgi:hypothetical protein
VVRSLSSQVGLPWFIPPRGILLFVGPHPKFISGTNTNTIFIIVVAAQSAVASPNMFTIGNRTSLALLKPEFISGSSLRGVVTRAVFSSNCYGFLRGRAFWGHDKATPFVLLGKSAIDSTTHRRWQARSRLLPGMPATNQIATQKCSRAKLGNTKPEGDTKSRPMSNCQLGHC